MEAAKQRSGSLCPSCRRLLLGPWRCFMPLPLSPSSYKHISFARKQTEPLLIVSSSTSWSVAFFYVSLPLSLSSYKNISFAKSRGQKRPATDAELPRNLCSIAPLQSCCKLLPISPCLRSLCFVLLPSFLLPPVTWWKKRIGLWFRAVKVACLTERTGEKKCPRVICSTECYIMIFSRKSCRLAARRRKRGKRRGTRLMCLMELCFMILS